MAASIFSLMGEIFIDNEKANKSIDETTKKGKNSEKSFSESLGNVVKSAVKVGTVVVGATTAAVSGLTAMANQTAETADAIDKGSIRMGISTNYYQELKYAAGQCGVEMSTLEKAAKKLEGTNINMEGAMEQIMSLGTAEERAAKASELFGDTVAYQLSPLIEQSGDDFDGLINRANELGIVMSEDAVNAGVKFGDTLSDVKQSFSGVFNSLMSVVIPILQVFLNLIVQNMPAITGLISTLAPVLTSMLESILPPFIQLCQSLLPIIIDLIVQLLPFITSIIENLLPVIVQLLDMLLPPLLQLIELILPIIINLITPLLPLLEPIFALLQPFIDLLMALLVPLLDLINLILPPIIELFTTIISVVLPPLQVALNVTARVLTTVFGVAFSSITPIIEGLKQYLNGIIDFITGIFSGNWKKAWNGVKEIFSGIVGTFSGLFKAPINFIIDGVNTFIKSLNKLKIPDWVPGVGGKGLNLSLFNKLRVGIDRVPYDEMPALLHKDEAVLDADEAKQWRESKNNTNQESIINNNYNNYITIEKLEIREEKDIERIAEELYYLQKKAV